MRAGLNLPHSCKGGHCASCRARILAGEVAYPRGRPAGITEAEEAEGFALLCQARAVSDLRIETREVRPAPDVEVKSLPCRIERMERLADDVMAVFLRLPAVEELHYRPGQYLDVMLSEGRRRSFSIAGAPGDGRWIELHVRRASKSGFTGQLFDTMHAGTLLRIEGPLGQFWLRTESPRPPLMIGGGTGYAPLRAMVFVNGSVYALVLQAGGELTQMDNTFVPPRFKDSYGPVGTFFLLFKTPALNAEGGAYVAGYPEELKKWNPYADAKPCPTPRRNYEMILCAKEGKIPFMMHTEKVVERFKAEMSDPKELNKKIKLYESEAWEDFLDMTIQGATNWAAHNVDPLEKPMELQLSDSVFIGSHACSCGACSTPRHSAPAGL